MNESDIAAVWTELVKSVADVEVDVLKNARGVTAAGTRARKGLRQLRMKIATLVKMTVILDKDRKVARATKRAAKKAAESA